MQRIGRYEILEEIGRGGFGRVYRANDPSMKCEVAIKVMANADDPEMLARFRNEAAAARKLNHESIVTIYDIGEEQGIPYIVMEYLQGTDLQKIREQGTPLTLVQKVRILSQIAAGLQVAHEHGVIHRDVKPANIMLLRDGSVKIMDFGIARLSRDGVTNNLTRTGFVVGTVQYIPPEQFEGHPVDTLADLWAFGIIAFQLLTGRNLFEAADIMQVIYNVASLPIPDVRQLNPEVPEELGQLVHKLLQRERAARYQTFEDVRVDLNPILESLEGQEASRLVDQARVIAARGDLSGAHQMVRQVLERYPSNTQAKQIRDHIITQVRANEASRQVEQLLKKGDQDFSAGSYDEALDSYGQACKLNPNNTTAQMRLERARTMAERTRRLRDAMSDARSRLAAGAAKEAQAVLAGILAEEPDNAEAFSLLNQARQERARQEENARADAILLARHLASQQQYAGALAGLEDCVRRIGDHPDLRYAMEEVRRAERAGGVRAHVEALMSIANQHVRNGDHGAASAILAPLAVEYPDNTDVRELLKFVAEEEARNRRVAEQRAREQAAARPSAGATPAGKLDRATVIPRVLELTREREQSGQISEAVHILDVALSRFPDAQELVQERFRLLALKPAPVLATPAPAPAVPAVSRDGADLPLPPASGRRALWMGLAGLGVACAVLVYWQLTKTSQVVPANSARIQQEAAVATSPPPAPVEITPPQSMPSEPALSSTPNQSAEKAEPPLASLLPPRVNFAYENGGNRPPPVTLRVVRTPLQAVVRGSGSWLSAEVADVAGGLIRLSLKPTVGALPPGEYHQTVQVTSNRDSTLLDVDLAVSADTRPQTKQRATQPVVAPAATKETTQAPATPEAPSKPTAPVPVTSPAVKMPYNGPKRGTLNWNGNLAAGARLVLGESSVLEGGGTLSGSDIPPTDVAVAVTQQALDVRTLPPPNAQRVVITNSSGAAVYQIRITWNIK